ncbi:MAG: hypothetical protein JXK07_09715 [Spirochaetes bacterium]|nr:hypothetical protein [Spirochaetota bacterium]MBN2769448.1 hypothetical protein [Spirochaetota bacterium]
MKSKANLCVIIFIFIASFSSLSAETRNRFSAGVGTFSMHGFGVIFLSDPGETIDSSHDDIDNRYKESKDQLSDGIGYQASYDRMVFKYLALGIAYNYENSNYRINYNNYDTSETDLTVHCFMPRVKIIHGFKRVKMYHALAVGYAIFDETLTEKISFVTESKSKISYEPVIHFTLVGFEFHLDEDVYLYIEHGYGYSGFFNIGAGYLF